ncbi:YdbL family protein [Balneatrix alpica]|uniref:YdbL family protein n=1 Tax=Balneatrix alpica TaxID=75684 RepID=A0ABV5ZBT8_9GAMM|nr:YdbL family protein [Balneatrix alpica]
MASWKYLLSLLSALLLSLSAWALSLDEAKNKGLVGESNRGYLVVLSGGKEVQALADEVNRKRRSVYQENAKSAGVTLEIMEQRIGQRLFEMANPGQMVQNPSGQWLKK